MVMGKLAIQLHCELSVPFASDFESDHNCRSIKKIIDKDGNTLNSYKYDPFGILLQKSEQVHNIFQYRGSLGIVKHSELQDMYSMRDRVYDARLGRFISIDPLG